MHRLLVACFASKSDGGGVQCVEFDGRGGSFGNTRKLVGLEKPFFLASRGVPGTQIFSNDSSDFGGRESEFIVRLQWEGDELRVVERVDSRGSATCHLALDATGRFLFAANYCSGNVCAYRLDETGGFERLVAEVFHSGSGRSPERQEAPHPHCIAVSPNNDRIWVADLGTDRVETYLMDQARMPLRTGSKVRFLNQRPGAGPRHVRFSPDGRWFAVVNELDSTLALYRTNANHVPTGAPHVLSTLPVGFNGGSTCADVAFSPCGAWVFVTNRGHDSIAVFKLQSGGPALVDIVSSGAPGPQNLWVSGDGRWLLCANMPGGSVVSFRLADLICGKGVTVDRIEMRLPACLLEAAF